MSRRIGFLIDFRLYRCSDGLRSDDPMVRFAAGFREHFDEVVLLCRVCDAAPDFDVPYSVPDRGIRVVPLPFYSRISSLYLEAPRYWPRIERALRDTVPSLSALWLNFGHPVSHRALTLALRSSHVCPFAAVRGAYDRDAALRMPGPGWLKGLAGGVMRTQMKRFARLANRADVPCFAFGNEMATRLRALGVRTIDMVDSLLTENDLRQGAEPAAHLRSDLLGVGRLDPEKGFEVLLRALAGIRTEEDRPANLRIVGSGECESELKDLASALGVAERVQFDGYVPFGPDLFARYASTRMLVIPSHTEGVPKTAYEAMAFGVPVLATAVGGLPDVVGRDDMRGRLVPPGDSSALARAATEMLQSGDELRMTGRNARAFAREITMERQVRRILEVVNPGLLEEGNR